MITLLQRDLGVRYNPAKKTFPFRLSGPTPLIHGIIQGNGGTCASLPVVYVAVGRRLGFPLFLVKASTKKWGHTFVRWDEPGERFNIEATVQGPCCDLDHHYRTGVYEVSAKEEQLGGLLSPTNSREICHDADAKNATCGLHYACLSPVPCGRIMAAIMEGRTPKSAFGRNELRKLLGVHRGPPIGTAKPFGLART
jgi:hypothetical protein